MAMATALGSQITTFPGAYLATLTTADKGYAFTYPVGVPLRVTVQPHVNVASVTLTESAITDGVTAITVLDGMIVAASGSLSWVVNVQSDGIRNPPATQFVLASASGATKVLIWLEELEGG